MKKVIIVGATSGIGRSLAKLFAHENYLVGIIGRRTNLLEEIKSENPNYYEIKTLDITDLNNIPDSLTQLTNKLGGLNILIICSGTGDINTELDFETEKRTIDTNVCGFTAVADWSFNYFLQQKHGHLVGISSIGGLRGNSQAPSYSASKAFQINYLESLRIKAAKTKLPIYISDIRPGFVDTEMAKGDGLFWVAPVERVASQIFKTILKKRKIVYITRRWKTVAVLMKIMPNWLIEKM
jgi:short-subunit dehydrogenase